MRKWMKRLCRRWADCSGATLVEMIVAFALLGIFLAAASMVISAGLNVYYQVHSQIAAQDTANLLLDKAAGELAGAQVGAEENGGIIISDGTAGEGLLDFADGEAVAFYNRGGSPVYLYADEEGHLVIHYRPVYDQNHSSVLLHDSVDWYYDEKTCQGFRVTDLRFVQRQKDGQPANVFEILLTIENSKTGVIYSAARTVRCHNFSEPSDVAKIVPGGIRSDETYADGS